MSSRDILKFVNKIPLAYLRDLGHFFVSHPDDDHLEGPADPPLPDVLAEQDAPQPRPAPKNIDVCERCGKVPGIRHYDWAWCCAACGQSVLDSLDEEKLRPVPPRTNKPTQPFRPGQRGRRK
jgi:hypothetical protein